MATALGDHHARKLSAARQRREALDGFPLASVCVLATDATLPPGKVVPWLTLAGQAVVHLAARMPGPGEQGKEGATKRVQL